MAGSVATFSGRFNPSLASVLLTLVFFSLFVALGMWQLDRAEQRRALGRAEQLAREQEPLHLNLLSEKITEDWHHRRATFFGYYDPRFQLLLDNRTRKGVAGYEVLTPFFLEDSSAWLLVNRGWLAAPLRRSQVPSLLDAPPSALLQSGSGNAVIPTSVRFRLPGAGEDIMEPMGNGTFRIQHLSVREVEQRFGLTLLPFIVRLDVAAPYGYLRQWPVIGEKFRVNLGYAVQWFTFAAISLVLFFVLGVKRAKKSREGAEDKR